MEKHKSKPSNLRSQASLLSKVETSLLRKKQTTSSSVSRLELNKVPITKLKIDLASKKPHPMHTYHEELFNVPHSQLDTVRGRTSSPRKKALHSENLAKLERNFSTFCKTKRSQHEDLDNFV